MIRTLTLSAALCLASFTTSADVTENNSQNTPGGESAAVTTTAATGTIARAVFTTDIQEREPVDSIVDFANDRGEQPVYFFTDLRDFTGETLTHRWEYNGQVMAEVTINVGGPRWRAYSRKAMLPEWNGTWTVTVLDSNNSPLQVSTLEVTAPQTNPPTPQEPSAADTAPAGEAIQQ